MSGSARGDVFRIRGFAAYWASYTVSGFGAYVTTLALQVLVLVQLGGTAVDVGLVSAARWLPYLLVGLLVGALVDRRRRRPLLIGSALGRAVLLLLIPAVFAAGWLRVPVLLVVVAVVGLLSLVGDAAAQALVPRIVPRRALVAAHARTDQSDAIAQATGPLLAGALVSAVGAAAALVVDAVASVFSALAIFRVRVQETVVPPEHSRSLRREIAEGLRWVYRHRVLGPLAIGSHVWFLFSSILNTAFVPFVLVGLGLSAFQLGVALAGAGAAALLGSSLSLRAGRRWGAGVAVIVSNLAMALGWAMVALVPATIGAGAILVVLALGQGFVGFGMGLSNANEMGYRQAVTPDELQARTNTTMRSANRAMIVIGAPLGGLIATVAGYRPALWLGVAGVLAATAILAFSPARSARHDLDAPPG